MSYLLLLWHIQLSDISVHLEYSLYVIALSYVLFYFFRMCKCTGMIMPKRSRFL